MERRAVIEQPITVVGGFRYLMDSEKAAHSLDLIKARAPQTRHDETERRQCQEPSGTVPLQQHDCSKCDEHDLKGQLSLGREMSAESNLGDNGDCSDREYRSGFDQQS